MRYDTLRYAILPGMKQAILITMLKLARERVGHIVIALEVKMCILFGLELIVRAMDL